VSRTNWESQTVDQMRAGLFASDPSSVRAAATRWQATGDLLTDMRNGLGNTLQNFSDKWAGGAADAYQKMITDLASGIGTVASDAYTMENLTLDAADALDTARAQMPGSVAVPTLPGSVVALATTPLQLPPGSSPAQITQAQQQQQAAVQAVNAQQQAVAVSDAAHAKAVAVMTTLSNTYTTVTASIPAQQVSNDVVPQVNAGGTANGTNHGGTGSAGRTLLTSYQTTPAPAANGANPPTPAAQPGSPATTPQPGTSPLFGDLFSAGIAAAAAAGMGRFNLLGKLPSWVNGNSNKNGKGGNKSTSDSTGNPDGPRGTGSSALGGAGIGSGAKIGGMSGIGGGGGAAPATPTASSSLFSGQEGASPSVIDGAAAGAAAGGSPSSGMMPMMPMGGGMGGAGAQGMDGNRRIPPWLTETEDVWGESATISPPVIGQ
jgi:hypothetical protein